MKKGQNDIYYITGESVAQVPSPPFIKTLRKKGYEVLHMVDSVVEYAVQQLKEFDGKKLKSVTIEGLDLDLDLDDEDERKAMEELKAEFESLHKLMKEVLGDKTENVMVKCVKETEVVRTEMVVDGENIVEVIVDMPQIEYVDGDAQVYTKHVGPVNYEEE